MTVDRTSTRSDHQPTLPFAVPVPDRADGCGARADPGHDWRLDEHTRRVGRRGVAAARALLEGASAAPENPAGPQGGRAAGRAA